MNGIESISAKNIYLDYNATTPVDPHVSKKICETLTNAWGNPSSSYPAGKYARHIIDEARNRLCSMINGNNINEIIFMSGGTEANNNVIYTTLEYFCKHQEKNVYDALDKPHIIASTIEHDSIKHVLDYYKAKGSIDVSYIPVSTQHGFIQPNDVMKEIRRTTVLVTIMLANNETGAIQPVSEICHQVMTVNMEERSRVGLPHILLHTDAAQAVGKIRVDVKQLGVDYLTIVGHKFYAPRIGALWVRENAPFYPMFHGGGQENNRRPGTENTCMIAGLGEAARLVNENLNDYTAHFEKMSKYLRKRLITQFGKERIVFNQIAEEILPNTVNVSIVGEKCTSSKVLGLCKVLEASKGAACHTNNGDKPSPILLAQGVPLQHAKNAIRLSVGRETSENDIDSAVNDLLNAACTIDPTLLNDKSPVMFDKA